jgi:hypothetical protein
MTSSIGIKRVENEKARPGAKASVSGFMIPPLFSMSPPENRASQLILPVRLRFPSGALYRANVRICQVLSPVLQATGHHRASAPTYLSSCLKYNQVGWSDTPDFRVFFSIASKTRISPNKAIIIIPPPIAPEYFAMFTQAFASF